MVDFEIIHDQPVTRPPLLRIIKLRIQILSGKFKIFRKKLDKIVQLFEKKKTTNLNTFDGLSLSF